ncbi:MAG: hypothetical protein NXY57DRAFT_964505 [Lentinula lateritia]|uniref:Uncharacterized protein n=1 Tax=Lentinula lateritia TaxID=40482 RepID=A0ABQ8V0D7_9AGAR|nr:MAG: hypothetical protein NXY57DRAFT_964505 [Lentinula lateritia]KAJ4468010.1 hypothetical protein C8R41DRAFT_925511 [Lentinula lateritia]KAJ4493363.1 hypothetical protein C8R41DRAFT_919575 [Lentinula lateritia]
MKFSKWFRLGAYWLNVAFTLTTTTWFLKFNQFYLQLAPEVDNNGRIEVEREGLRMEDEDVKFKDVEDGGAEKILSEGSVFPNAGLIASPSDHSNSQYPTRPHPDPIPSLSQHA